MTPKIYRYPKSTQIFLFLGVFFFTVVSFLIFQDKKSIGVTVCTVPMAMVLTVYLWWSIFRVEVTDSEISTFRIGQKKSIRWDEIGEAKSKALENDLLLISVDAEKKIKISSQVVGYDEIIDQLRKKRPDLWKNELIRIFHQNASSSIFLALLALFLVAIGVKGIIQNESIISSLALLAFGFAIVAVISQVIWLVEIRNDELGLKTMWREQKIKRSAIKNVWLSGQDTGYLAVTHFVIIELIDNKPIRLGNFREGIPVLYNSLKSWHEGYSQS